MQKNRGINTLKRPKLKFGQIGVAFAHESRVEVKFIFQVKKLIKKLKKKKRGKRRRIWGRSRGVWFFLFPNFIISRKSKNSRMGKGKGEIQRWTIRVRCGLMFMEFKGFADVKINKLREYTQKKTLVKLTNIKEHEWFYSTVNTFNSQQPYTNDNFTL